MTVDSSGCPAWSATFVSLSRSGIATGAGMAAPYPQLSSFLCRFDPESGENPAHSRHEGEPRRKHRRPGRIHAAANRAFALGALSSNGVALAFSYDEADNH